jgi:GTP cyclohydrolase I
MKDLQSSRDDREIPLDHVGVRDVRYPIVILDRNAGTQQTVGRLSMSVDLPHHFRGTHMSRFIEVLEEHRGEVTMRTLPIILDELRRRLEAARARIEVRFPYFLQRSAPVSHSAALMDYDCWFVGEATGEVNDFVLGVVVPVTSLCPCSKAISDYGAHNQRGHVSIEVRSVTNMEGEPAIVWIEELVAIAEHAASAPVYPLLKRVDERHVTMQAYDNPRFVEDIVREVSVALRADVRVASYDVEVVNQESIHNHSAFASSMWSRVGEAELTNGVGVPKSVAASALGQ